STTRIARISRPKKARLGLRPCDGVLNVVPVREPAIHHHLPRLLLQILGHFLPVANLFRGGVKRRAGRVVRATSGAARHPTRQPRPGRMARLPAGSHMPKPARRSPKTPG